MRMLLSFFTHSCPMFFAIITVHYRSGAEESLVPFLHLFQMRWLHAKLCAISELPEISSLIIIRELSWGALDFSFEEEFTLFHLQTVDSWNCGIQSYTANHNGKR